MKRLIYSLIFISTFLVGCEEFVDIDQPGRLGADQAFTNVEDLELGILGVYNRYDYTSQIQFNSLFTDQLSIGIANGGQGLDGTYGFLLNSTSGISISLWNRYYGALNASSRVIEAAATIEPDADEVETYNSVLGQAHALRAWAHFILLTYYSPDLTNDAAQGIIALNFVPTSDQELARSTTGEIFAAINEDLGVAEGLLVEQSNPTFVSRDFITALRARIAAYRGNYTEADGYAATLLNSYPIADRDQYEGIFADTDNSEIIFKLERTIGDTYDGQGATGSAFAGGWAGANFAFVNSTVSGTPYFEMSNSLFDALNPDDVRYNVLVEPTSDIDARVIPVGKYRGSESQPLMNDLKIFRSSDMLLIRAEAAADAGNLAAAANFVDQLRDARFGTDQPAPSYSNAQAAFADILNERRIEFAYEGFRWVDLKRLGSRAGVTTLQRAADDCAINGACSLPLSDIRMQAVPIPISELDANDVIQQTDGY